MARALLGRVLRAKDGETKNLASVSFKIKFFNESAFAESKVTARCSAQDPTLANNLNAFKPNWHQKCINL